MRLAIGFTICFIVVGMLAEYSAFAQQVDRRAAEPDLCSPDGAAEWPLATSCTFAGGAAQLQPSLTLGEPRAAARRRVAASARNSATSRRDVPELRLAPALHANVPSPDVVVKPAASGEVLNLEGLVRASRMQIREGTVFLEGDIVGAGDTATLGGGR